MAFASPYFLTSLNFSNLVQASSVVAVLAIGQLLVILIGAIDLSAGAVLALATVIGVKVAHSSDASGLVVVLVMLGVGAGVGLVNALVIERWKLANFFVMTLGTMSIATGASYVLSNGGTVTGFPGIITWLGAGTFLGLPASLLAVAGLALVTTALTHVTRWGRWVYAVGGNREAASRVGIPVRRVAMSAFVFSGLAAGLGAILTAGLTNASQPAADFTSQLDAISAVIIGGAAVSGGRGTVFGTLIGALILGTVHNGLNLLNVNPNWEPIALGLVLVLAVSLDTMRGRLETRLQLVEARKHGDLAPDELSTIAPGADAV
jgi:ribose transport system permease protein